MCLLVYVFGKGVWAVPVVGVSVVRELQRGTAQYPTAKEELVEFGPLYGNLESLPSGFIIIMEDDTPDVLIRDMEGGNQRGGGGGSSSSVSGEHRYNNPAC